LPIEDFLKTLKKTRGLLFVAGTAIDKTPDLNWGTNNNNSFEYAANIT
jgi:hypothetical protein|tara:strand:+ start:5753 stop:5896 length:144 start_codon:yes stop_codon:yes gene_type:complete